MIRSVRRNLQVWICKWVGALSDPRVNGRASFDRCIRVRNIPSQIQTSMSLLMDCVAVQCDCFFNIPGGKEPLHWVLSVGSVHFLRSERPLHLWESTKGVVWSFFSSSFIISKQKMWQIGTEHDIRSDLVYCFDDGSFWWCEPSIIDDHRKQRLSHSQGTASQSLTSMLLELTAREFCCMDQTIAVRVLSLNGRRSTVNRPFAIERHCLLSVSDHSPLFLQHKHPSTWCIRYRLPAAGEWKCSQLWLVVSVNKHRRKTSKNQLWHVARIWLWLIHPVSSLHKDNRNGQIDAVKSSLRRSIIMQSFRFCWLEVDSGCTQALRSLYFSAACLISTLAYAFIWPWEK